MKHPCVAWDLQGAAASLDSAQTAPPGLNPNAASLPATSGLGVKDTAVQGLGPKDTSALGLGPAPPKVSTHVRSASALPAAGGAGTAGVSGGGLGVLTVRPGGLSAPGAVSPRRLEGLVHPGAIAALQVGGGCLKTAAFHATWHVCSAYLFLQSL
jgi:hypothetical protein